VDMPHVASPEPVPARAFEWTNVTESSINTVHFIRMTN
jgi:hypothetical protein